MTAVIEAEGLGKRYRRQWALADCTLSVPAGHVVGLVGPNGAGKTTLLNLATGMLAPTAGTIEVLGGRPAAGPAQLARVGYLAQDAPVYAGLSVADHLKLGAHLNPGWDAALARGRIERLDLDPGQKAGTLSGGQRAQLALTLAVAKRPELLILDEPVASLDPLARREFLQDLMEAAAEQGLSRGAVLAPGRRPGTGLRLPDRAGRLAGPGRRAGRGTAGHPPPAVRPAPRPGTPAGGMQVISASHTDVQSTLLVRTSGPVLDPAWTVSEVGLEDLVLAYMSQAAGRGRRDTATWRCRNDLADLAAVPRPGRHRGRGAGRVRGPARGHRAAPGQPVRRQRHQRLPGRSCAHLASSFLQQCTPPAPTRSCTCSASRSSSWRPPSSASSGARR